jgi:N6-adenosine-specific RNA methylase IME4
MKYRTIVADPPWPYDEGWPGWGLAREERRALPYPAMSLKELRGLPIRDLLEPEGYAFLWTTNRYLEEAFAIARAWTLVPRQTLTWCKPARGKGPGGMFATTTEFIVVAQRIGPRSHARGTRTLGQRIDTSWFIWARSEHSQKPEAFLDLVETVSPGPYLELFARRNRLGWDTWGNESLEMVKL